MKFSLAIGLLFVGFLVSPTCTFRIKNTEVASNAILAKFGNVETENYQALAELNDNANVEELDLDGEESEDLELLEEEEDDQETEDSVLNNVEEDLDSEELNDESEGALQAEEEEETEAENEDEDEED